MPESLTNLCKIFADDTKLYGSSKRRASIQEDLLKLMEWSEIWQLNFNIDKCCALHFGNKNPNNKYYMDKNSQKELTKIENEKDVGVTFDHNLFFNTHISNIIKKGNRMKGLIQRSFEYLDKPTFNKLYKSLIRPQIEYANVVWHPLYKGQMRELEKVQRRSTKLVPTLKKKPYKERLQELDIPSIQYRQLRNDLIQAYKIINNIDNIQCNEFFTFVEDDRTRNSTLKLFKPYARTNIRSNYFSHRVVDHWNGLSETTKLSKNINEFKMKVDRDLIDIRFDFI